jgi:thermitase
MLVASVSASAAPVVKGYVLVKPKPGLPDVAFGKALAAHGSHVLGEIGQLGIFRVAVPANAAEEQFARRLAEHPHIKFAEPDELVAPAFSVNDPYAPKSWHLAKVNAPAAWDVSKGNGVIVAVLDSGIDAAHPDLAGALVPGWNLYDNNGVTADVYGHGTKVAGVVGARGNNGTGVTGLAWQSRMMPVRVTDTSGNGTWSAIAGGLSWAADHGAKVANLSFAVQGSASTRTAAQYFRNKGGVVVNSAGNSGTLDPSTPTEALVSVSATDSADKRASWSNYGAFVDVSAPGVSLMTTTRGGGYGSVSGP